MPTRQETSRISIELYLTSVNQGIAALTGLINIHAQFSLIHSQSCQKNCLVTLPSLQSIITLKSDLEELKLELVTKLTVAQTGRNSGISYARLITRSHSLIVEVRYMEGFFQAVIMVHLHLTLPNVSFL